MSFPPSRPRQTTDEALEALYAEPFRLVRPSIQRIPFVFASPHSGRLYPQGLLNRSRLGPIALRRSEDAFVDELFCGVSGLGAPLIAARFPRAFLDANRAPGELDPAMFEGRLAVPVDAPGPRVDAGLGVIPRIVRDGAEIYSRKLLPLEAEERLARLYRPYHAALAGLVEETLARFGVAIVIDCHSMPSALAVPDIVLGDRYGVSAAASFTRAAEEAFAAAGFSVTRNVPYAGGHTTLLYGRGGQNCHALQIEINRGLYLDENRIARAPSFDQTQARLTGVLARLADIDAAALRRPPDLAEAAE